jgi:hypothetical protein
MGRVMSLFAVVLLGGTTVGGPLAAAVTAVAGCRAPFIVGAGSAVIAASWSRAFPLPGHYLGVIEPDAGAATTNDHHHGLVTADDRWISIDRPGAAASGRRIGDDHGEVLARPDHVGV